MNLSAVMLGVRDLGRAKAFYRDGLGATLEKDYPNFVSFTFPGGPTELALYDWDAAADDAGVSGEGSGFRGFSLHILLDTKEEVDRVISEATSAGATVVKAAQAGDWGGYVAYLADPDGYLWKVAAP